MLVRLGRRGALRFSPTHPTNTKHPNKNTPSSRCRQPRRRRRHRRWRAHERGRHLWLARRRPDPAARVQRTAGRQRSGQGVSWVFFVFATCALTQAPQKTTNNPPPKKTKKACRRTSSARSCRSSWPASTRGRASATPCSAAPSMLFKGKPLSCRPTSTLCWALSAR